MGQILICIDPSLDTPHNCMNMILRTILHSQYIVKDKLQDLLTRHENEKVIKTMTFE